MLLLIIAVILICSAMSDYAAAADWERSEEEADRRHEERLREIRNTTQTKNSQTKIPPKKTSKVQRRRVIKDADGHILYEEIIVDTIVDD